MTDRDHILALIYQAVDEVNLQFPPGQQVPKCEETRLIAGALDSLAFMNLVVTTEEKITSWLGVPLPLVSSLMESGESQLPQTIADLAEFAFRALANQKDG
jgi:hypothetical protein